MKGMDQTEDSDLLKMALILEERERRFFPVRCQTKFRLLEVGKNFSKGGPEKGRSRANSLKTLVLNQLLLGESPQA